MSFAHVTRDADGTTHLPTHIKTRLPIKTHPVEGEADEKSGEAADNKEAGEGKQGEVKQKEPTSPVDPRGPKAASSTWKPNLDRQQSYNENDYKRSVMLQRGMSVDGKEARSGFSEKEGGS